MTCIVGYVRDGRVWLGGDGAAGARGYCYQVRQPKVFQRGPLLVGYTWSFRLGQLLQYSVTVPAPPSAPEHDAVEWLATAVVDAVRECFKAGGWADKENDSEAGGQFLLGYAGRLFVLHRDYSVQEYVRPYAVIGCGEHWAMGALQALEAYPDLAPETRIRAALTAAATFSDGVCEPFTVLVSEPVTAARNGRVRVEAA